MALARPVSSLRAKVVRVFREGLRAPASPPALLTPAERWQLGYDAFVRGEIPPADPDEADGWYWAENEAPRHR